MRKAEDLYRLCDEEFVWRTFKDEPVLFTALAAAGDEALAEKLDGPIAARFGIPKDRFTGGPRRKNESPRSIWPRRSLPREMSLPGPNSSSRRWERNCCSLLSFGRGSVLADLQGQPRFDQELLDWLKDKPYPVIDVRDAFRAEYQQFRGDAKQFLDRYYIGHHSPAGNFFLASAVRDRLIKARPGAVTLSLKLL